MKLKPNKELAIKVSEAIERDASASPNSRYSFDHFLKENNLYSNDDKHRMDEVIIRCVFHGDTNPSLSINESKRIWHCLGCNRGGSYVDFVKEYDNVILGQNLSWYDELNKLLKSDPSLMREVGFDSIFRQQTEIKEFEPMEFAKFKFRPKLPQTYLELATVMKERHCSIDDIKYCILSMQAGISSEDVYRYLYGDSNLESATKEDNTNQKEYDINAIMGGEEV